MTHPSKRKGDRAELEAQGILRDLLGVPARRKLGAGRKDDMGDIDGVPDTVISVGNIARLSEAVRVKPRDCETQQERAGALFGATFVRLHGGEFRVVLTPEQFATLWREAQPVSSLAEKWDEMFGCVVDESAGLDDGTPQPGDNTVLGV
jgi:hypothetical protein